MIEGGGEGDGGDGEAEDSSRDSIVYLSSEEGDGDGGRLDRRRRQLRRQLAGARVDLEKDVERSELSAEDAEAVLEDIDYVLDVLEKDADAGDYLEAVRRSRDAVGRLSRQSTYLGVSLGLAGLLLRFRITAKFAAVPVAAYLLYLLFRNVQTIRTAVKEGRHVVAVRVPNDAVPADAERIPFGEVRGAEAIDRAVEKAVRAAEDDDVEWTSRAIDLGGAKDMDDVVEALSPYPRASDGSYYVQHERGTVAVDLVGDDVGVRIETR